MCQIPISESNRRLSELERRASARAPPIFLPFPCRISTRTLHRIVSTVFSVTDISGSGIIYDSSQNSASQLTIAQP